MNKKILTIMTALVLALAVAMPVMADETVKYAKVEDCTKSDSYDQTAPKVTPDGSKTAKTTLTYSEASLKIVTEDKGQGRPAGYSWLGFTVKMPSGYTKYKLTYNGKTEEKDVSGESFDEYVGVSPKKLEEATKAGNEYLEYNLDYEWIKTDNGSESVHQTILIRIKLSGVTLKDEQNKEVWNNDIYEEAKPVPETNKKPAATTNKKKEKDNTPGTGVENVYAVAGLVAVVTLAGAVVLNKRK